MKFWKDYITLMNKEKPEQQEYMEEFEEKENQETIETNSKGKNIKKASPIN